MRFLKYNLYFSLFSSVEFCSLFLQGSKFFLIIVLSLQALAEPSFFKPRTTKKDVKKIDCANSRILLKYCSLLGMQECFKMIGRNLKKIIC